MRLNCCHSGAVHFWQYTRWTTYPNSVLGSHYDFYRAMHLSAKRGIAIACRSSVCPLCPSVTLVDQDDIGWQSRTLSLTPSLFRSPKAIYLFPGEHGEILGRLEVGWEKVVCWSTKAAISLKRVKIVETETLLRRAYRKSPTLFPTIPFPTSYVLLFPKIWVRNPHPKLQSLLVRVSQERVKLRTSNFVRTFIGSIGTKVHLKFRDK